MHVRVETSADLNAVRELHLATFDTAEEAGIVDRLRTEAHPTVSLVATDEDRIVGHAMFSPASLDGSTRIGLMALGPMAVVLPHQRKGIGSILVAAGLEHCWRLGSPGVVVVGHSTYYPRFGFVPASRLGLRCEFDIPDDVFMALERERGILGGLAGLVRFHAAFAPE